MKTKVVECLENLSVHCQFRLERQYSLEVVVTSWEEGEGTVPVTEALVGTAAFVDSA